MRHITFEKHFARSETFTLTVYQLLDVGIWAVTSTTRRPLTTAPFLKAFGLNELRIETCAQLIGVLTAALHNLRWCLGRSGLFDSDISSEQTQCSFPFSFFF